MARGLLVAVVLVGLLGAAWFVLADGGSSPASEGAAAAPLALDSSRPGDEPDAADPLAGLGASPRPLAGGLHTPPATELPPAAPAASGSAYVGLVLRASDRSPVAGVTVTLLQRGHPDTPVAVSTDVHGRFVVPADGPATWNGFHVAAGADSGALTSHQACRLRPAPAEPVLLLVPGVQAVSGRVLDEGGQPLARATVRGWSRQLNSLPNDGRLPPAEVVTTTDSAGRFAFASLGPDVLLDAEAPGLVCVQRAQGRLEAGSSEGVELVLAPAVPLEGLVLSTDGALVPGLVVLARQPRVLGGDTITGIPGVYRAGPASQATTCDDAGRFRFEGLAPRPVTLVVEPADRPSLEQRHDPADGPVELRLDVGTRLTGRVLAADARPVAGAEVTVITRGSAVRRTLSDADGRFELDGLPATLDGRVLVQAEGHALAVHQPLVLDAVAGGQVTLRLEVEAPLAGRLVDADGEPLAGVDLELEGERVIDLGGTIVFPTPTWERALGRAEATTDADGRFRFERLYPGEFVLTADLSAELDEGRGLRRWTVSAGQQDLQLSTSSLGAGAVVLHGTVLDRMTGLPVTGFRVSAMRQVAGASFGGPVRAFADPGGQFTWGGLEPGPLRVSASADGYTSDQLPLADYAPGEHHVELRLRPHRSLTVGVLDEDGRPHPDVLLTFADERGASLMIDMGSGATSALTTNEQGLARAHGLPAGRLTVRAWPLGGGVPLVAEDERLAFTFDLWEELPGVQWVTVARDEPEPRRSLRVSLLGHAPGTTPPLSPDSPEGEAALRELAQSGTLWPFVGRAELLLRDVDGGLLEQLELASDGAGAYRLTRDGLVRDEPYPTVSFRAPLGLVELIVRVDGAQVARWALAEDAHPNLFAFVVQSPP